MIYGTAITKATGQKQIVSFRSKNAMCVQISYLAWEQGEHISISFVTVVNGCGYDLQITAPNILVQ